MEHRFLFFIEREFHVSLFKNIIRAIHRQKLGEIGIYSFRYQPAMEPGKTLGARLGIVRRILDTPFVQVNDPWEFAPSVTFTADSGYEHLEGLGKLVSIGHGTISKGSFYTGGDLMFRENAADLICVPGSLQKELLGQRVCQPIIVTGIPKLDPVFDYSLDRVKLLTAMGLSPEKKTVLLAPTFNPELSLLPFIDYDPRAYIADKYNLIVKLHSASSILWQDAVKTRLQGKANSYFTDDPDIAPYLSVADVLLTDVSSVIYEFLALHRPVLLFDSPLQKKHPKYSPNLIEYRYRDVGFRFHDPQCIAELLNEAASMPLFPSDIASVAESFLSIHDGTSTQRVLDATMDLLSGDTRTGTVVLAGHHPTQAEKLSRMYAARFHTLVIPDPEPSPLQTLAKRIGEIPDGPVIYLDTAFQYSPLTPVFLSTHLELDPSLGVTAPLTAQDFPVGEQQIVHYFPETARVVDERIAGPLSYRAGGRIVPATRLLPCAFACRLRDVAAFFSIEFDLRDPEAFSRFCDFLQHRGMRNAVVLSSFMYRSGTA